MAWKIERDHIAEMFGDESERAGFGRGNLEGETFRFRLRDEDGEIHYSGRFDRDAADNDMERTGLYSLWEFGMADTGATDLELHRDDALALGFARPEHVDRHTRDGWTTIYA